MERRFGPHPQFHLKHFHAHGDPLPEFPALSHVHEGICLPTHDLAPHTHPHFEICYVHAGGGTWFAEGKTYHLKPGDIYVTKPGEIHGGRTDPKNPFHLFALALDISALPGLPSAGGAHRLKSAQGDDAQQEVADAVQETETLQDDFRALDMRIIPGGEGLELIFRRLLSELDQPAGPDPKSKALKVMMVQALLVELLVFVARCSLAHAENRLPEIPAQLPQRPQFKELLSKMQLKPGEPMSLAQMAKLTGLSPTHFAVAFKRETGKTPLEALTQIRIDSAAHALTHQPRRSVTDIALDLGFTSSQYFSIVFKKCKGCTPSEWRHKTVNDRPPRD